MTLAFLTRNGLRAIVKASVFLAVVAASSSMAAERVNPGWLLSVSGATITTPDFPGSERYSFINFPAVSVEAPSLSDHLVGKDESLSLVLFSPNPSVAVGAVGRYDPLQTGRAGLSSNEAQWSVEPGVFAEYWPAPDSLRIRGEIRLGTDSIAGMTGTVGADYVQRVGKFIITAGPHFGISGTDYTASHYGADYAALGYAGGTIDARSFGAAGLVKFAAGKNWTTSVFANYDRVMLSGASTQGTKPLGYNDEVRVGASLDINLSPPSH
jgi:outer membrane scaffolding protein for murein synthesis (MipA/OmpV family)